MSVGRRRLTRRGRRRLLGVVALFGLAAAIGAGAWALRARRATAPVRYPEITAVIMARVDVDQDGRVDAAEFRAASMPAEPLAPCDLDADGSLTAAEVEAVFLEATTTRPPLGGGPGAGPPGAGG